MKIGLFGGTFDPIHWGHLRSAEEVREAFALDRVLLIPAASPPHKKRQPTTSPGDRLKMVRLAIAKNPSFAVSTVEISRRGKSYSVDTIRHFAARWPKDALYFILGLDAFREIGSWKDFQEIFPLCHFIVISRPGHGEPMSLSSMPVAVRRLFCYDSKKKIPPAQKWHHSLFPQDHGHCDFSLRYPRPHKGGEVHPLSGSFRG